MLGTASGVSVAAANPVGAGPSGGAEPTLRIEDLPRMDLPPPEKGAVVPSQVLGWRREAEALEHGDGVERDEARAATLYCRAARYGDAEAQYSLGWMLTNARGIERNDAEAAHLFAAAAEQGHAQAANMARTMGTPQGPPPPCLRPPPEEPAPAPAPATKAGSRFAAARLPWPPAPPEAPAPIVRFVDLVAPDYQLAPALVYAVMATESGFNASAVSPKNAQGLMQLIPDTARRFGVRNPMDPAQNIRGGMAYLRWLLAYFEGDVALAAAAYNAGERAVERYRGVPPYAETRLYVRKILARVGGRSVHPFDPRVTTPSSALAQMRGPARWQP